MQPCATDHGLDSLGHVGAGVAELQARAVGRESWRKRLQATTGAALVHSHQRLCVRASEQVYILQNQMDLQLQCLVVYTPPRGPLRTWSSLAPDAALPDSSPSYTTLSNDRSTSKSCRVFRSIPRTPTASRVPLGSILPGVITLQDGCARASNPRLDWQDQALRNKVFP